MLTQKSDGLFIIAVIFVAKINCAFAIFTLVIHTCNSTYKISLVTSINVVLQPFWCWQDTCSNISFGTPPKIVYYSLRSPSVITQPFPTEDQINYMSKRACTMYISIFWFIIIQETNKLDVCFHKSLLQIKIWRVAKLKNLHQVIGITSQSCQCCLLFNPRKTANGVTPSYSVQSC